MESKLYWAVRGENVRTVERCIQEGCDVNETDEDGETVLLWAIFLENLEIIKLLVENGANINFKGKISGVSPLQEAKGWLKYTGNKKLLENTNKIISYLKENGAKD
jgi:ankyrin repeat protein